MHIYERGEPGQSGTQEVHHDRQENVSNIPRFT
jgi:hypothetical protein